MLALGVQKIDFDTTADPREVVEALGIDEMANRLTAVLSSDTRLLESLLRCELGI